MTHIMNSTGQAMMPGWGVDGVMNVVQDRKSGKDLQAWVRT